MLGIWITKLSRQR